VGSGVLGIDLGTSQVKALVMDAGGEVLGRGRAGYRVVAPGEGRAETDPEDWWRATVIAVGEALGEAVGGGARGDRGAGPEIGAIAVAGQMHGVVLAGGDGTATRPAIVWLDRRASAEAARYEELPAGLTAPLGNQPSPGMAGPILCWLVSHEPDAVRPARWALQPKDWLRLRLTGLAATDPTDASGTLLFDVRRGAWAGGLIGALGLPEGKLPVIREPTEIAGRLLPGPARELGLSPGIPVATGAADTAAALYAANLESAPVASETSTGMDALDAGTPPGLAKAGTGVGVAAGTEREGGGGGGYALLIVGTGGQWVVPEAGFRPAANTHLFRAVDAGFYRLAPLQNAGTALDWVRGLFGVSWQELYDTAARPWRADTPVFLPYLARERWDPVTTGTWSGLTLSHQPGDLLRSALEGVAFLIRRRLEDLRAAGHHPEAAIVGGGGATHPAWRQLLADALGMPLHPADTSWLSPAGAARLAAAVTGMEGAGDARARSGYGRAVPVVPREPDAASAGYARFTHKLAASEIGPLRRDERKVQRDNHPHGRR
jgi:xylulokinase